LDFVKIRGIRGKYLVVGKGRFASWGCFLFSAD
jgi:hypothetical protein